MKKIYIVLTICLTSLISNSDIAIDFVNNAGYSATDDGTGQYIVMLVANDGGAANTIDASNLLGAGDNLLASYTTQVGFAGTFGSQGVGVYSTPSSGNVVIRIFDASGDNYGSQWEVAASVFTEYDPLNPGTIYSTDGIIDSPFTLGVSGTQIGHLGYYPPIESEPTVPEPTTVALIGLSTMGLTLYRRKDKIFSKFDAVDLINYKPESTISTKWKYR